MNRKNKKKKLIINGETLKRCDGGSLRKGAVKLHAGDAGKFWNGKQVFAAAGTGYARCPRVNGLA